MTLSGNARRLPDSCRCRRGTKATSSNYHINTIVVAICRNPGCAPPADLPRPVVRPATPILPPLMSPQQPSWKQEARHETTPPAENKPAEAAPEEPKKNE